MANWYKTAFTPQQIKDFGKGFLGGVGLGLSGLNMGPISKKEPLPHQTPHTIVQQHIETPKPGPNVPVQQTVAPKPKAKQIQAPTAESSIIKHEKPTPIAYNDSKGFRTVGIGFNLDRAGARQDIEALGLNYDQVYQGKVSLNSQQMQTLLQNDLKKGRDQTRKTFPMYDHLHPKAKAAVDELVYNMPKILNFQSFKHMLLGENYDKIAEALKHWKWYEDVGGGKYSKKQHKPRHDESRADYIIRLFEEAAHESR